MKIDKILAVLITIITSSGSLYAQGGEDPPVPIVILPVVSSISFGTFYDTGGGGDVSVDPQTGDGSATGSIITIGNSFSRAEYNITGGNDGTLIVFSHSPTVSLNRVGGGATLTMEILTYPSDFMVIEDATLVNKFFIGGTLDMSSGAPMPGTYTISSFDVTLNLP